MPLNTTFGGRVFQLLDSLDYGDAVCNQAMNIDGMLKILGIETKIYTTWVHESMKQYRSDLMDLTPNDDDIVIIHFAGFSDHAWPLFKSLRCTRIALYHNITPHSFFAKGDRLHEFCLKGRQQLPELVEHCHYIWADSEYNLQELLDLGAKRDRCAVVPIVVPAPKEDFTESEVERENASWLFLGRVAPNKSHVKLVNAFSSVRQQSPDLAQKLYLVGGYDEKDPYYLEVKNEIARLGLVHCVQLTGKVPDAEVKRYFAKSTVYVSMSEHEGFGVPLIEAALKQLPVVALATSGVGETMGPGPGLVNSVEALTEQVKLVVTDATHRAALLKQQRANTARYTTAAVGEHLEHALGMALPQMGQFKTVSIVICTYNRCDLLERCLDYLQYQHNQNFEVVVVNGPSTDGTALMLEKYAGRIKLVQNPERNLSISRNLGIEQAAGDLTAFIDDDALPFDDWVDTLLREFNGRPLTLAGLGGPAYLAGTLDYQDQDIGINRFAESKRNISAAEIGRDGWERSLLGTNTCFRSDTLRSILGFDEQFDYFLDESELCYRLQLAKYIVGYCPDLYLRHEFAQSHNREGRYKFNWRTICKNIAYFASAYSGLKGAELEKYLDKRMRDQYLGWLKSGLLSGEVTQADYDGFVSDISAGVKQGLLDARDYPKTRPLDSKAAGAFAAFGRPEAAAERGFDFVQLHICIVTQEFPPFVGNGGIGTLYYNLASEFLLMGHRVTVLTPAAHDVVYERGRFVHRQVRKRAVCEDTLKAPGFINNMNWSASALHAVAELHEAEPIDIVDSALWDVETLMLSLLPKGKRPPVVVRLVTPFTVVARLNGWNVPDYEHSLFRGAERSLIMSADAVVPISESIASTIEYEHNLVRDERWVMSHCGIAYWPSFDSRLGYAELGEVNGKAITMPDAKMVLFIGRLEGRKGVPELIEAAESFLTADPSAHLILAGKDGDNFEGKATLSMPAALFKRMHFVGQVDDATRDKLLHGAHCVVFPSRYESFGLVPLEAFVHGVPVVAAKAGAIPEVVAHDECGLLFKAGDADALAEAVKRMLLEPDLRDRLALGAKKQIRHFSSRRSAIRAVDLYHSLRSAPSETREKAPA